MGRALIRQFAGVDRRRRLIEGAGFTPLALAPVSSWFRLAGSTITGSGYSSVRDVINPSSPATQGTDARRPPGATSSNGLPILNVTAATLSVPLIAARVGTAAWGFWAWLNQTSGADALISFGTTGGATGGNHSWFNFNTSGTNGKVELWDGASSRRCDTTFAVGAWKFVTLEFNGALSGDARFVSTINGAVQTPAFSGSLGAVPATLNAVTGSASMLSFNTGGGFPFVGNVGPNWGFLGAAMSGATEGLLTSAARTALMNFEAPT